MAGGWLDFLQTTRFLIYEQQKFNSTDLRRKHMSTEAKCPFHHGAAGGGTTNQDWWPNQLKLELLHQHSSKSNPMGAGLQLRERVQEPRPGGGEEGSRGADDRLAGLVAGGLRPLRTVCSFAWRGTAPALTAPVTAAAAPAGASSASRRSTVGRTTSVWTRRVACSGRSSRSMAGRFRGPI